jgi:hypothetical protein
MDISDVRNLQNVEETILHTPGKPDFDSALHLRLTIRSDGTAIPQFVYQTAGLNHAEKMKEGKKFAVDMTDAGGGGGEAYLGLDFGTSNTAVSYVDRSWVQVIESRNANTSWRELGELVDLLPSPLAIPLAQYIGDQRQVSTIPPAYSFIEAALCLCAYISLIEYYCTPRRRTTRIFRDFPHRSASAAWIMLRSVHEQLGNSAVITGPLKVLFSSQNSALLDRITRNWAEVRHELGQSQKDDVHAAIRLLSNASQGIFGKYEFGYVESVQRERFSNRYNSRFRIAHGKPPYTEFFTCLGQQPFSEAEAMILDPSSGKGLLLTPLVLWYPCSAHPDLENGHCYLFDKLKGEGENAKATFKAAASPCQMGTDSAPDTRELLDQLLQFKADDGRLSPLEGLTVTSVSRIET